MTFSIVAVEKETGETGFAIASCCWDAGQVCEARPEGAIASQASGNVQFLKMFFDKLAEGMASGQILAHFKEMDKDIETRQVGMITAGGETLAFTGSECPYWCGHITGDDYSCQGNILVGPEVVRAMASAFENANGHLFERLFAALRAGDAAGGDARGRQSARLMVSGKGLGAIDINIEDHEYPIKELGRILEIRTNLARILGFVNSLEKSDLENKKIILDEWSEFMQDKKQPRYLDWWESLAGEFVKSGDKESALEAYRIYLEISPGMRNNLAEEARAGRFPKDIAKELGII